MVTNGEQNLPSAHLMAGRPNNQSPVYKKGCHLSLFFDLATESQTGKKHIYLHSITPIKTVLPNWHWWLSLLLGEAAVYFKLQVSDSQTFLFKDKGERCFAVTCHLGKQTKEYKFKSWMPVVEELQELHTESFQECGIKSMVGLGQCFVRCQFLITVTGINTPTVTGEWKQEVWVQSWIPGILVELQKSSCEDLPSLSSQWYKSCNKMIHPDTQGRSCIPAFLFVVSHCPVQMTTSSLKQ